MLYGWKLKWVKILANFFMSPNIKKKKKKLVYGWIFTWSSQILSLLYITAAPKLLAGLMPVPVTGIVAK